MKIFSSLVLLFFIWIDFCNSQRIDTIYYDNKWNKSTSDHYKHYRIARQDSDKVKVFDYYKSGRIQMSGGYKTFDYKNETGPFYYYKMNRIHHMELYEPSKYPDILAEYKSVLENIPRQPDSLKLYVGFFKNKRVSVIGYISKCCYSFGPWLYLTRTGKPSYSFTYESNIRNGPYILYGTDNDIIISGFYKNNKKEGKWLHYFKGKLERTATFDNGNMVDLVELKQKKE